jgi:hypothetical protein
MMKLPLIAAALAFACACESPHDKSERTNQPARTAEPGDKSTDKSADTSAPAEPATTERSMIDDAVAQAKHDAARFDRLRAQRLQHMHNKLAFAEVQDTMLSGLADILTLTDTGRADVDTKLDALSRKLDQASLAIDQLDESADRDYTAAEQTAREAIEGVDTARAQAWRAIGDARRPEATAAGSNEAGSNVQPPMQPSS